MRIVAGALIALLGLALALFGPGSSAAAGSRAGRRFQSSDTPAFRLLGPVLVVLGLLYAAGLLG
ncbi:hypothetical protein ACFSJS_21205 [Streptomyces desertarenae]|uniref:DUF3309 domain-containing protein n=1 Tax=Streptomyces desertarenae TaxID=2666184 RepID=A0ABW4PRW3_9ACTN